MHRRLAGAESRPAPSLRHRFGVSAHQYATFSWSGDVILIVWQPALGEIIAMDDKALRTKVTSVDVRWAQGHFPLLGGAWFVHRATGF